MRRLFAVTTTIGMMIGLAGCGGDPAQMPDVANSRLDLALSDIERAGHDPDDVEIVGGGTFGVIDEGNWTVCSQEPTAGEEIDGKPRLVVERECATDESAAGDEPIEESADPDDDSEAPSGANTDKAGLADTTPEADEEYFVMPALVGQNLQVAQDQLQALGSFLLTQTDATGQDRFQVLDSNWKVCYQIPRAGKRTPITTLVDLGAVKLEEACP